MSEYQFYEFRAIDQPLSEEAQAEIGRLSSRVEPSPTSAIFTYSWGDFRSNPLDVLMKHFDILLYLANWGTRQLAFRLPRAVVDVDAIAPYLVDGMITTKVVGKDLLLNINIYDEEGDGKWDWIEGEGWMDRIAPVREELLRGDYRLLYLAWLAAAQIDSKLQGGSEPPVPSNLGRLSSALKKCIDFFDIDPDLVTAAAKASGVAKERGRRETAALIGELPESERNELLLRLLDGDALVAAELSRRLDELEHGRQGKRGAQPKQGNRRTTAQLFESAKEESVQRQKREEEAARKARIRELEKLGTREEATWDRIDSLLSESRWKAHEEAVHLLVDLRDLAAHSGSPDAFEKRFSAIAGRSSRRPALMRRFREAGLVE